jgi:hypothetical protein
MGQSLKDTPDLIARFSAWLRYLQIKALLEQVPWTLDECLIRVTPKGRGSAIRHALCGDPGGALNRHGVVQICLRMTAPFQTPEPNQLKALHEGRQRRNLYDFPSTNPPVVNVLIELLADALLTYSNRCRAIDRPFYEMCDNAIAALVPLSIGLGAGMALRDLERLPEKSPLKRLWSSTVETNYRLCKRALEALTPAHYQEAAGSEVSRLKQKVMSQLYRSMYEVIAARRPPKYPKVAVRDGIARILTAFGVCILHVMSRMRLSPNDCASVLNGGQTIHHVPVSGLSLPR